MPENGLVQRQLLFNEMFFANIGYSDFSITWTTSRPFFITKYVLKIKTHIT